MPSATVDDRPVTIRRPGVAAWRLPANVRELTQYADLLRTLTEHRIRVRHKQSIFGLCWALLQPVSMMLIFTLVFGRIARVSSDGVPYSLFAFSGLLLWSFVSTTLTNSTHALVSHAQLVTKVYFPREILPLSYVAAAVFDLAVGALVLIGLLAWYGRPVTVHFLLALPIVAIVIALTTAIGFALSAIQVRYRDVGLGVPLGLYLWMFVTPIAYPLSAVPARYYAIFQLNPLTGIVEAFRQVVLQTASPSPALLIVPIAATALLLPCSYLMFKRAEATMADVI